MPDESRAHHLPPGERPSLPELARSLRGLGSVRGGDAAIESIVFGPLLDARRAAEHATTSADVMRAFDTRRLEAALHAAVRSLAAERTAGRDDRRRALEAELEELVAPLVASLHRLAAVGEDRWGDWVEAAQHVFTSADRVAAKLAARLEPR